MPELIKIDKARMMTKENKPVSGSLNAKNVSMILIDTIQVMKKIAKVIMVACGFLPNKIFGAFGTDFVVWVFVAFIVFNPK